LFLVGEMLGPILVSLHNVAFFQKFMQDIRQAICDNTWFELKNKVRSTWPAERDNSAAERTSGNNDVDSKEMHCDVL
jgi:queuine/archaeosine tRNA-ribosyltransferase